MGMLDNFAKLKQLQSEQTVSKLEKQTESASRVTTVKEKVIAQLEANIKYLTNAEYMKDFKWDAAVGRTSDDKPACSPLWKVDKDGTAKWNLRMGKVTVWLDKADCESKTTPNWMSCGDDVGVFAETLKAYKDALNEVKDEEFEVYAWIKKPQRDENGEIKKQKSPNSNRMSVVTASSATLELISDETYK